MFVSMKKNEVLECLKTRRSIRAFEPDKKPSKELVAKVVEAGTFAPTGMGKQSPVIVAVMDKAVRDRLSKMNADVLGSASDPFYGAPVVLVVLADRSRGGAGGPQPSDLPVRRLAGDGQSAQCGPCSRAGQLLDSQGKGGL